jgi:hypothetical protein
MCQKRNPLNFVLSVYTVSPWGHQMDHMEFIFHVVFFFPIMLVRKGGLRKKMCLTVWLTCCRNWRDEIMINFGTCDNTF